MPFSKYCASILVDSVWVITLPLSSEIVNNEPTGANKYMNPLVPFEGGGIKNPNDSYECRGYKSGVDLC